MNKLLIPIFAAVLVLGGVGLTDVFAESQNVKINYVGILFHNGFSYDVSVKEYLANPGSIGALSLHSKVTATDLDGNLLTAFEAVTPIEKRPNYPADEDGFVPLDWFFILNAYDGPPFCGHGIITVESSIITKGGYILPGGDSSTQTSWISTGGGCGV